MICFSLLQSNLSADVRFFLTSEDIVFLNLHVIFLWPKKSYQNKSLASFCIRMQPFFLYMEGAYVPLNHFSQSALIVIQAKLDARKRCYAS